MRRFSAITIALVACTNPPDFRATGPPGLHVELVRRHVSEVLEGVVSADTELTGVELVLPNQSTQLQGFATGGNRPFSVPVSTLAEGEHSLLVRGTLNGGMVEESRTFVVDRRRPALASRPPATLILGASIRLTFSEPIALETVDEGLRVAGTDSWSWAAIDEATTLIVSLEWGFRAPGRVTLDLGTALTDRAGLGLLAPVALEVDFLDDPDGGDFVWAPAPATDSKVTTLQPRSAVIDCPVYFVANRLVHLLHFSDAGLQETHINEENPVLRVDFCTLNKPGPDSEVFLIEGAYRSLDVLAGDGSAASFKRVGPRISVDAGTAGLQQPTWRPAGARLPDGRVLATDGTSSGPQFWLFDGGTWGEIPAPATAGEFMAMHDYGDSVLVLAKRRNVSIPPVMAWVWRADQWTALGSVPSRSRCCVSSNRLLCLNEDLSIVELREGGVDVVGRALGVLSRPFRIADAHCREGEATWALDGDAIELRDREVRQWRFPNVLGAAVLAFPDGTKWFTQGTEMFRAARH